MKTRFWKVQIETYEDGRILAAVLGSWEARSKPANRYKKEPRREIFVLWFTNNPEAESTVIEARTWNIKEGAAA